MPWTAESITASTTSATLAAGRVMHINSVALLISTARW